MPTPDAVKAAPPPTEIAFGTPVPDSPAATAVNRASRPGRGFNYITAPEPFTPGLEALR
ncbi:hypothetical protein ACIBCN_23270 [Nocardia sp. NPDC051052]|uniref:hypothetical protein n=1 Tax=Nocardia sp. NPDC051052 TaxID=3364322 RepID=UPI0037BBC78C